jgi:hypothetical protein
MSKTKMTAANYRKEIKDLQLKRKSLSVKIAERLHCLCERFPDAIVFEKGDSCIKAKSIGSMIYISRIQDDERLQYIEAIEKHIANLDEVKQQIIDFKQQL